MTKIAVVLAAIALALMVAYIGYNEWPQAKALVVNEEQKIKEFEEERNRVHEQSCRREYDDEEAIELCSSRYK